MGEALDNIDIHYSYLVKKPNNFHKCKYINANPSNFKVSVSNFKVSLSVFTDRIKQGRQFGVILFYSLGVSFSEVKEGLKYKSEGSLPCVSKSYMREHK